MSMLRKLLCCCYTGGNIADLKRISRPVSSAVVNASKKAQEEEKDRDEVPPDVVTSHEAADDKEVSDAPDVESELGSEAEDDTTALTDNAAVEDPIVPEIVTKEVEKTPPSTPESSRSVATAGLTLTLEKPAPAEITQQSPDVTSPRHRSGKSGRSLFQIKRNSSSSADTSKSSVAPPVDKVLLVQSKKSDDDGSSSGPASGASDSEDEKK